MSALGGATHHAGDDVPIRDRSGAVWRWSRASGSLALGDSGVHALAQRKRARLRRRRQQVGDVLLSIDVR